MSWKQTIGIILALGLIVALCFAVIFPALYDFERSGKLGEIEAGKAPASAEEGRGVLPKLKGLSWKAPDKEAQKTPVKEAEKAPEKEVEKTPVKKAEKEPEKKRTRQELEARAEGASEEQAAASALLELQEVSWFEQGGYAVVTGTVKNVSDRSLPSIQVHARFLDEARNPLVSEHSLIDLNPIFPGQVSTFSVAARFHPDIEDMELDFTLFSGAEISWSKLEVEKDEDIEAAEAAGDEMSEGELMPESEDLLPETAEPFR